jgi:hypothetical protein
MKTLKSVSVKDEILKYFEAKAHKRYKLPEIGVYFPSVLCNSCTKSQWNYYQMAIKEGKLPQSAILQMGEGTVTHELIQSLQIWDATEIPVKMKINTGNENIVIRGRADGVIGDTVFEFKRTQYIPLKIRFSDALQINFYMEALGKPKGILVYIGYKSDRTFDVVERYWTLSDWHTNHLINRAITLHTLLKNKQEAYCSCRSKTHDQQWEQYKRGEK